MPIISIFLGIIIRINFRDHPPPHLHAEYQGFEALFAIQTGERIAGRLPRRIERLVLEWMMQHRMELMENWALARDKMPTFKIAGLDQDD